MHLVNNIVYDYVIFVLLISSRNTKLSHSWVANTAEKPCSTSWVDLLDHTYLSLNEK